MVATLSGTIDGGLGGVNLFSFDNYATAVDVALTSSTSNGFTRHDSRLTESRNELHAYHTN